MICTVNLAVFCLAGVADCFGYTGSFTACAVAVFIAAAAINGAVACMCVITV